MYLPKVSQKITKGKAFETYPQRSKDELAWEHNKAKLLGGDTHELAEVAVEDGKVKTSYHKWGGGVWSGASP
jgi:hypothetical protein